jgi:hypothetical protein
MIFRVWLPLVLFVSPLSYSSAWHGADQSPHSMNTHNGSMPLYSQAPPYNHNSSIKAKTSEAKTSFLSPSGDVVAKALVVGGLVVGALSLLSYLYNQSHRQVFQAAENTFQYYRRTYKQLIDMEAVSFHVKQVALKRIINAGRGTYKYVETVAGLNDAIGALSTSAFNVKARIDHIEKEADEYRAKDANDANSYTWLHSLQFLHTQQEQLMRTLADIKSDIELLPEYEQQKQQCKDDAYRARKEDRERDRLKILRDMHRELLRQQWQYK